MCEPINYKKSTLDQSFDSQTATPFDFHIPSISTYFRFSKNFITTNQIKSQHSHKKHYSSNAIDPSLVINYNRNFLFVIKPSISTLTIQPFFTFDSQSLSVSKFCLLRIKNTSINFYQDSK